MGCPLERGFRHVKGNLLNLGDIGKLTVPEVVGVNPWLIIAIV
jgi:hypothetical protein